MKSLYILKDHNEVSPEPTLLHTEETHLIQPISIGRVLQHSDNPHGILWIHCLSYGVDPGDADEISPEQSRGEDSAANLFLLQKRKSLWGPSV